jgi:hypothetical protein
MMRGLSPGSAWLPHRDRENFLAAGVPESRPVSVRSRQEWYWFGLIAALRGNAGSFF